MIKWGIKDLASIPPECLHPSFWQVHIKSDFPLAVMLASFTFEPRIVSDSFHLLWVGSIPAGKEAKGQIPPQAFPLDY